MAINWQDQEVKDRLLAAIIASFEGTINCREVARLYGGEATYNAIQNFLRKPKKQALALKADVAKNGRDGPAPSPARPKANAVKGASAKADGVKTGRVSKARKTSTSTGPASPLKKMRGIEDLASAYARRGTTASSAGAGSEDSFGVKMEVDDEFEEDEVELEV